MSNIWVDAGAIPPNLDKKKLAEYLRSDPAIIDKPDPASGLTPLAIALRKGNSTTVNLLLHNGASPEKKTQDGRTPMYMAVSASNQRARMVQQLLAKNPINFDEAAPASFGEETPLMAAVRKRDGKAIRLLVEAGASKEKKNIDGQTAMDLAEKGQPPDLEVKKALEIVASRGRGDLLTYIHDWVLQVLAYFNIWSPLADIFDASARAYHKIAGSGPRPGEDIEEPQTAADFKHNLDNAIKRSDLDRFFPPDDPYVRGVAHRAFELKTDRNNSLNSPSQIDGLAKLALYQPILYCDDSGSMVNDEGGKRWTSQIDLGNRISSITTWAVPNNDGCHLRFINKDTSSANHLNQKQIDQIIRSSRPSPHNYTPIGTKLREHVLDPFIYKYLDANVPLKRPYLVLATTDGFPTGKEAAGGNFTGNRDDNGNEDPDRFRKEIRECGKRLEEKGYRRDAVRFSISQLGNIDDEEDREMVKRFLDGLEFDDSIWDVLYRTAELMDARYDELKENEKNLEVWLLTTLLSPLQSMVN